MSPTAAYTPIAAPVQRALTLVMSIKSPQAYQELKALLDQIQGLPPDRNPVVLALNSLRNVHFARFVFLNNNTQLAVITTYDGTFEAYINEFIDAIGDVFNQLLERMDGAPPLPVQKYRNAFLDYVRANDIPTVGTLYSAYPKATVLDIQTAMSS